MELGTDNLEQAHQKTKSSLREMLSENEELRKMNETSKVAFEDEITKLITQQEIQKSFAQKVPISYIYKYRKLQI